MGGGSKVAHMLNSNQEDMIPVSMPQGDLALANGVNRRCVHCEPLFIVHVVFLIVLSRKRHCSTFLPVLRAFILIGIKCKKGYYTIKECNNNISKEFFCQYHWVKTVLLDKQMVILVKVETLKTNNSVQNKHCVHTVDMFTDKVSLREI